MEAEPQVDQEAHPQKPTGNTDEMKPEIASRERSVFEFGSTSHGRILAVDMGLSPQIWAVDMGLHRQFWPRGFGSPPPILAHRYGSNLGRGYGPLPHLGGRIRAAAAAAVFLRWNHGGREFIFVMISRANFELVHAWSKYFFSTTSIVFV